MPNKEQEYKEHIKELAVIFLYTVLFDAYPFIITFRAWSAV